MQYTSPNENFEYGYLHSNVLLQVHLKLEHCKPHKVARHPMKYDIINGIKLFLTVYCRIYCRKFLTLSNQTLRYKSKCIRMVVLRFVFILKILNFYHRSTRGIWKILSMVLYLSNQFTNPIMFGIILKSYLSFFL